jgi:serine/threonine protein kinase
MVQSVDPSSDYASKLESAIARYLEDEAAGKPPYVNDFVAAHPELADDLRQFLTDHERMQRLANSSQALNARPGDRQSGQTPGASANSTPATHARVPLVDSVGSMPTAAISSERALGQFGDYELLEKIAQGGMGVVYKARQVSLNRIVAVKMILSGNLATNEDIERFTLEAKAVAKLKHPQIVVIHDVGCHDDQHFYSMEFIEGRSLADEIRRGPMAPRKVAEYIEQIARALDFAHRNGVVHRDVKPSNVLIDEQGRGRVTDFGLAKHVDRGDDLTLTGQIIGTPAYMAPEQITNRRGEIGPACDIYSLGSLLYELLSGRPPFVGQDQFSTLLQVLDCDPQSLRQINAGIPRDLETICRKCLEKDPEYRYASAADLADDLARFLAGDSIKAASPKLVDRLVRTLERSQYDREFQTWARMMMHLAWISFATHALVYFNYLLAPVHPLATLTGIRLLEIVAMGVVLWSIRREWFPPQGAPARQLLSLWLGYVTGSLALTVIAYRLSPASSTFNGFAAYPPMAVLASLLFMMLGSSYWGYCYVIGGIFLASAVLMTAWLSAAPLIFGIIWAASLLILSRHLARLASF